MTPADKERKKESPIESAMMPRGDDRAFFRCLVCGLYRPRASMAAAKRVQTKHVKATGHSVSIVMEKCDD